MRRLGIVLLLLVAALWVTTLYVSRPLFSERLGDLPPLAAVVPFFTLGWVLLFGGWGLHKRLRKDRPF